MGTINTKAREKRSKNHEKVQAEHGHRNWMDGMSYDISDPILRLRLAASSCFFGEPMYYHKDKNDKRGRSMTPHMRMCNLSDRDLDYLRETLNAIDPREWRKMSPTELMESAIDEALNKDVAETLKEAVRLRTSDFIRTTPQVIMVRAANHKAAKGTGLIRSIGGDIIARPDELAVQLAYQMHRFGKPIPNSLKKAWRKAFEKFNDYQLAKYRMESRDVKLVDVMNLCHPKSEAVSKLATGKQKTTDKTWESIMSTVGEDVSDLDEDQKVEMKKEGWEKSIEKMGHMALLRNLRNFILNGVSPDKFVGKLVQTAKGGKQLPFRYYSAYKAIIGKGNARIADAIEECLEVSLGEMPKFAGRTMSLCDFSGSAQGTSTSAMGTMRICDIGGLTGAITARCSDEGFIGIFGDDLNVFDVRKKNSVFDTVDKAVEVGHGIGTATENGIWLFFDNAIKQKEHWDNVFVYSDMQAGHGGLYGTERSKYRDYIWGGGRHGDGEMHIDVAKLILDYRAKVNPKVNVFLVQIAGHQDTIVPEFYERTYILGGWGPGLLHFAASMNQMHQQ